MKGRTDAADGNGLRAGIVHEPGGPPRRFVGIATRTLYQRGNAERAEAALSADAEGRRKQPAGTLGDARAF